MKQDRALIKIILDLVEHKYALVFWYFVRLLSALLPLYTIYLFGQSIRLLEQNAEPRRLLNQILLVFLVRFVDNISRLLSIHCLEYYIQQTELSIHQFLIFGLKTKPKNLRHQTIQAIRNFGEAIRTTLFMIRQPGLDGLVSFVAVPVILYFLDFKVFILNLAYMIIYYTIDVFTTERYAKLKNTQNSFNEAYYARLQDSNNVQNQRASFLSHLKKLCRWGFVEWNLLQNTAVFFYVLILSYLLSSVHLGQKQISDLVLIIGYISTTQVFLNNISSIKDCLADSKVALSRLSQSKSYSVDFSDLT